MNIIQSVVLIIRYVKNIKLILKIILLTYKFK